MCKHETINLTIMLVILCQSLVFKIIFFGTVSSKVLRPFCLVFCSISITASYTMYCKLRGDSITMLYYLVLDLHALGLMIGDELHIVDSPAYYLSWLSLEG